MRTFSMSDVGTRYEHLADLQELWNEAMEIIKRNYQTPDMEKRKHALETALNLLQKHMEKDYNESVYENIINEIHEKGKVTPKNEIKPPSSFYT